MGASTEQYRRRKAAGLCVECGKPLDRIGAYCVKCCKAHTEDSIQQKHWYADNGICPTCRTNKLMGTERHCPECRARESEWKLKKESQTEKTPTSSTQNGRKPNMPKGLKKAFVLGAENDQLKMVHAHACIALKKLMLITEEREQRRG